MIQSREIELVPIKEIKINPKNRNKHDNAQIERLIKIIGYQGFRNPLIVSNRTGLLVAGHGRLEAARKMKLKEVPVMKQDFADDAQEYAAMVSDNSISSWSELDISGINADLPDLGKDFDIDLLGIKNFEIGTDQDEPGCDEDDVPEHVEPKTRLGDIYQLGGHRLMCGDSTSIDAVEGLMAGAKADMVFTDPPYGMNLDTDYSKMGASGLKHERVLGDGDDFKAELIQTLMGVFDYCEEIFLFGADYYAELIRGKNDGSWIVWDKRSRSETEIGTLDGAFGSDFETCWSKKKRKRELARVLRQTGVFAASGEDRSVHPTQKPIALVEWFFERAAGNSVADLFGGSGSTLIACEKTKRTCYMMELDPKYVDVIVARWEKYTGKKAELIHGKT